MVVLRNARQFQATFDLFVRVPLLHRGAGRQAAMGERPVLVVDDDADMRHLTETVLAYAGIATVSAVNGLEALERARSDRPSVILLDLMMPVMDGYEFRARQLQDPVLRKIPVICVTAVPPRESEARKLQVDACVQKPVDWEELLRAVLQYAA